LQRLRKIEKTSAGIADVTVEMYTGHISKTSLDSYCYMNLLGASDAMSEDDFELYTGSEHGASVRGLVF
jgi:hypothetical protein